MSNSMLEQAIIDAKELREAAVKNAESHIIEKYSSEVKQAVSKLLEQDEESEPAMGMDMDMDMDAEPEVTSTAMEQVPMAHLSSEPEDDMVVVNLDDIIAAAGSEDEAEIEDGAMDREEIADEVGISLDMEDETVPANRDDELELDEDQLVDLFKEMLAVDVPQEELDLGKEESVTEDSKDELEKDEDLEMVRKDGMAKEDIEEYDRQIQKNESLQKENNLLKNLLEKVKDRLEETNLQNARLLYANRVLSDNSLNEQQKKRIVGIVDAARSVEEAKMVYETLQKTTATRSKNSPESLSEVISKSSSVILAGNRDKETSTNSRSSNTTYNRWATLAGTKN